MKRTKNITGIVKKASKSHATLSLDLIAARLGGKDLFPEKTKRAKNFLRALNDGQVKILVKI